MVDTLFRHAAIKSSSLVFTALVLFCLLTIIPHASNAGARPASAAVAGLPADSASGGDAKRVNAVPRVIMTTPALNANSIDLMPEISAMFSTALRSSSVTASNFIALGSRSGRHAGTVSYDPGTYSASVHVSSPFLYGETVEAVVKTGGILSQSTGAPVAHGYAWKFMTGVSNGTCEFAADERTIQSSGNPSAVAAADFNRDGYTDFVAAKSAGGSIDVFMNTKRQAFTLAGTYPAGSGPVAVATGDFNGDGWIDIACAASNSVSVFLNNGSGGFTLASTFSPGSSISALAVADLNNDGAPDIAVTNAADNSVIVLRNNGTGSFSVAQTITVGLLPSGIALEDLNNDGTIDALVCNRGSNSVTVLTNSGTAFAVDSTYQVHTGPAAIVSFDFDNDGYMDLATANSMTNDVSVMLNNKNNPGHFIGPGDFAIVGDTPTALCGGDFDGDGDIDLAIACAGTNSIAVLQNNGYSFPTVKIVQAGTAQTGIAALDMSGVYGILDLVTANGSKGTLSIIKNAFFIPPPAELTLSVSSLVFPETAVGSSNTASVRLSAAFSPLTIDSVTSSSGIFTARAAIPCVIPSYGTLDLPIAYSPASFGQASDVLNVYSSAGLKHLSVSGSSPVPTAEVDRRTIDFGDCKKGSSISRTFTVLNHSLNAVYVDSLSLHSRWFRSPALQRSIESNDSLVVTVSFSPDTLRAFSDTLFISTNAETPVLSIILKGNSPVPTLTVSSLSLAFGNVKHMQPSARQIILKNPSLNTVSIDSLVLRAGAFVPSLAKRSLAQAESLAVSVTFTPNAMHAYADTLAIMNSSDRRTISVALSGDSPVPSVSLSAQSLSYGNVKVKQSALRTLVLKNTSFNDVIVDTISTLTRYFKTPLVKGRIVNGDSLAIALTFSPDTLSAFQDTLRLRTNTDRVSIPVALSGNSPVPSLIVSSQSLQFGNVRIGDTAVSKIVFTNMSLNDVVIDTIRGRTRSFAPSVRSARIAQADSLTLTVAFVPDTLRDYADTLLLSTNSDRGRISVIVWGRSPAPVLTLSASALDFGKTGMKRSSSKQILLTNTSLNTVSIDSFTFGTRAYATLRRPLPLVLKTDDTATVVVVFSPDSTFRYADTLSVHSRMLFPAPAVALSGEGEITTSVQQRFAGIPDKFSLSQNFPNPFNPVTTIQFAVPQAAYVSITVYDVTGREIADVFRNSVLAGYYSVQWNALGVSSGIYFYRIRASSLETGAVYNETRKLVILK